MAVEAVEMQVQGSDAVMAALRQFPARFVNKAMRRILRDAMKRFVLSAARRTIAVLTGAMRGALKVRAARGNRGQRLQRGRLGVSLLILEKIRYARWVLMNRRLRDGRMRPGDRTLRLALFGNQHRIDSYVTSQARAALPKIAAETRQATKRLG